MNPVAGRERHRVDGYRLIAPIGVGGSATVYRAVQESTGADVAVKVLADNHSLVPSLRQRFVDEVQLMAEVDSRSLAEVYEVGETAAGQPYLVLELADRGDLRTRLDLHRAEGRNPTDADVMVLAEHLAEALGSLHDVGIVHRDVSPGNLLIAGDPTSPWRTIGNLSVFEPDERLLMADLGLAKDLEARSGLTVGCGTQGFAAPEQQGPVAVVDRRADVYGATAVIDWFVEGTPLAARLAGFVEKGRADELERRHRSMDEWLEALETELAGRARMGRLALAWSAAAAVLALVVIGGLAWAAAGGDEGRPTLLESGAEAEAAGVPIAPLSAGESSSTTARVVTAGSSPAPSTATTDASGSASDSASTSSPPTSAPTSSAPSSSSASEASTTPPTTAPPDTSTTAATSSASSTSSGDPFAGSARAAVTSPAEGSTVKGDLRIEGTATYPEGVGRIELVVRPVTQGEMTYWNVESGAFTSEFIRNPIPVEPAGGATVTWSYTVPAGALEPGEYFVRAWARGVDGSGDPASSIVHVTVGN